jgi:uncharacterized protein YuzE
MQRSLCHHPRRSQIHGEACRQEIFSKSYRRTAPESDAFTAADAPALSPISSPALPSPSINCSTRSGAGVVLDYDAEGTLVGIDIDHASRKLDLRELTASHIPLAAAPEANQASEVVRQ